MASTGGKDYPSGDMRPTEAVIDLAALSRNVSRLVELVAPAKMCAVVKADAYGHGLIAGARAALAAGASWLAVALVEEGVRLREAGIAGPILTLSEPRPEEMIEVVAAGLTPSVYTGTGVAGAAAAASAAGVVLPVHICVDTGMRRVGADVDDVVRLANAIGDKPSLNLEGIWTHCAVADEPDNTFTATQFDRFEKAVAQVRAAGFENLLVHAGNSAVAIAHPRGRYDMVRCGIACYGLPPSVALDAMIELEPCLSLSTRVRYVKTVAAGEGISYGLRHVFDVDTVVATIPIGYADGMRRNGGADGVEVLVAGKRCPIVGTVTMDQIMIDCTRVPDVQVGDEVVLIGPQGDDEVTATELATRTHTINYEIVCGLGPRVRRTYR